MHSPTPNPACHCLLGVTYSSECHAHTTSRSACWVFAGHLALIHLHMLQASIIARDVAEHASSETFVRGAMAAPGTCAAFPVPSLLDHLQHRPRHPTETPEVKAYRTLTPRCRMHASLLMSCMAPRTAYMIDDARCLHWMRPPCSLSPTAATYSMTTICSMHREDDITADAEAAGPQTAFEISAEQAQNYQDLRAWVGNGSSHVSAFLLRSH